MNLTHFTSKRSFLGNPNPVTRTTTVQRVRKVKPQLVHPKAAVVTEAPVVSPEVVNTCINSIRFLAIDAVNKAKSGHPGCPMGAAPMAYVLWNEVMKYNPKNPKWYNRDRFVLSAGHASMMLYALMYLTGYDSLTLDDLKQFRQRGSKTPGHPENHITEGVEVTTGPLGQGFSNAVGIALAEANIAARYNKPDFAPIVDYYTYVIAGDGCMMEGISNESASLAGHWGLGKLIVLYDDNHISIDGSTDLAFTEDVSARFEALGWHVQHVADGNQDLEGIRQAVANAKAVTDKPSMIKVTTLIGYGSPNKANTHGVHGAPLGEEETTATRKNLNWSYGPFEVPPETTKAMTESCISKGTAAQKQWENNFQKYAQKYPEQYKELQLLMNNEFPAGWEDNLPTFTPEDKGIATRAHSQTMINALAEKLPHWIGGSADLAPSNLTLMKMFGDFQKGQYAERNLRFGVREHAMGGITNGIALSGTGLIPYAATFLIFTDYMRNAIRLSGLSFAQAIYVMTHDSIGLGEDGPTHQPIEHLASFRAMPNMYLFRPCGGNETAGSYIAALKRKGGPSLFALSRQGMTNLIGCTRDGVQKGGYVVQDCDGAPQVILIGTGSELPFAVEAATKLGEEGIKARVVSMVCWELFEDQTQEYKDSVLPPNVKARVSIEAACSFGWERYIGQMGKHIGIDSFGFSAPGPVIYKELGITSDGMVAVAKEVIKACA
eukprot:TRINITY_DN3093_c0_g1_i1.p1 TRINITY_DN3093_c0_g1~~TRINITY_DN3093_c0_g1_i1.p1  ORF type:complete len:736 (-),score=69.87 TRINITY_DN3093_c0_g1_i1:361-2517(-)